MRVKPIDGLFLVHFVSGINIMMMVLTAPMASLTPFPTYLLMSKYFLPNSSKDSNPVDTPSRLRMLGIMNKHEVLVNLQFTNP